MPLPDDRPHGATEGTGHFPDLLNVQPNRKEDDFSIDDAVFDEPASPGIPAREAPWQGPDAGRRARRRADSAPGPGPQSQLPDARLRPTTRTERKSPDGARSFTRVVARPQTSYAAQTTVQNSHLEPAIDPDGPAPSTFGKIAGQSQPVYRPDKLGVVLDNLFATPGLRWLDALGSRWVKAAALSLLAATVTIAIAWRFSGAFGQQQSGKSAAASQPSAATMDERMERARTAFRSFLAAQPDSDERAALTTDPARTRQRMAHFHIFLKGADPEVLSWEIGPPRDTGHGPWFPLTFDGKDGSRTTIALSESDGRCLVDWENFVSFGDVAWPDFCSARSPDPRAMRVFLRPATDQPAVQGFRAFLVRHRSGPPQITAWIASSSRASQAIADLMPPGGNWASANLYLSFAPDDGPTGARIVDVIRGRWQDTVVTHSAPQP
jgi:hypothetical protein